MIRRVRRFVTAAFTLAIAIPAQAEAPRAMHLSATYSPPLCGGPGPFADVPNSHDFCPYIRDLKLDGLTIGCGGGKFCPDNPVTRGQLAMYLERVMRGASSWDAWTDGPVSPSGLNWGAKTASSAVGTMMEYSLSPSGPGNESGIYFDDESVILWAPGGTGVVRIFDTTQGTDDEVLRISDGSLNFRPAGENGTGSDSSVSLRFFDDGTEGDEILRWNDDQDRFELSNDLALTGDFVSIIKASNESVLDVEADDAMAFMLDDDSNQTNEVLNVYHNGSYTSGNQLAMLTSTGDLFLRGTVTQSYSFDLAESFLESEPTEPGDLVRADPRRANAVLRAVTGDGAAVLGVVSTAPGIVLGGAAMDTSTLARWGHDVTARFADQRGALLAELLAKEPDIRARQAALATKLRELRTHNNADRTRRQREAREHWEALGSRIESELLRMFFARHFAPVALSGRVPVKVDASWGAIAVGDPLTASPSPGVAMRAGEPGPIVGTALESWTEGSGKILMMVGRGWWGGEVQGVAPPTSARSDAPRESDSARSEGAAPSLLAGRDGDTLRARGGGHAELFAVSEAVEPGDVLVMNDDDEGLRPSDRAEDATVVGVVATRPGVLAGVRAETHGEAPVVVAGVAWVKVDAAYGAIRRGDLLVTSPTRGHAMRADEPPAGTVVGKALESFDNATGTIRVLVMLR